MRWVGGVSLVASFRNQRGEAHSLMRAAAGDSAAHGAAAPTSQTMPSILKTLLELLSAGRLGSSAGQAWNGPARPNVRQADRRGAGHRPESARGVCGGVDSASPPPGSGGDSDAAGSRAVREWAEEVGCARARGAHGGCRGRLLTRGAGRLLRAPSNAAVFSARAALHPGRSLSAHPRGGGGGMRRCGGGSWRGGGGGRVLCAGRVRAPAFGGVLEAGHDVLVPVPRRISAQEPARARARDVSLVVSSLSSPAVGKGDQMG